MRPKGKRAATLPAHPFEAGPNCIDEVVVGVAVDPAIVFAAFAAERILTLAVLTPGAAGFVEVGMTGTLVALGVPAGPAAAGVLLYRGYTFLMEIPTGGAGMLWWWLHGRRARPFIG